MLWAALTCSAIPLLWYLNDGLDRRGNFPYPGEIGSSDQRGSILESPLLFATEKGIRFFQEVISPVDGKRCGLYPSCSNYSLAALREHGLVMGLIMTFDRLMHEPDEVRSAAAVIINGVSFGYDPLERNDFWWSRGDGKRKLFLE